MKIEYGRKTIDPTFVPIHITVTLESFQEEDTFRHLTACWNGRDHCSGNTKEVMEMADKMWCAVDKASK